MIPWLILSVKAKMKVKKRAMVGPDVGLSFGSVQSGPELLASGLLPEEEVMLKQQIAKKIRVIHKIMKKDEVRVKGTHPNREKIFKQSLRNEMNKLDMDGVKTLMQHSRSLCGPLGTPDCPPTLNLPNQVYSIYTSLEEF